MQKWIFCDFDNTLMGSEHIVLPSLIARINQLYGAQIGRDFTLQEFVTHFQGQAREVLCGSLSNYLGIPVSVADVYEGRDWQVVQHCQRVGVPVAPNMLQTMQQLQQQGYGLAIVSNNSLVRVLAAMRYADDGSGAEIAHLFGTHIYSAIDTLKPDPRSYLRALEQAGCAVEDAVAVEDSPIGAQGAINAGIKTFGFLGFADDSKHREQELLSVGVTQCFSDWKEFPELLKS